MVRTVRTATFELLRGLGLTTVFGNPGSTEEPFLQQLPADFRYVLALHEASVVAMADGYAQAVRHPALVNLHTAAGLGNAMGALGSAAENRTPLVVTAGQQTREMLLLEPWLVNPSPESLPQPWVKWAYQPVRPDDVPAAIMRAYAVALQPPAGPVFLSIPMDDWDAPVPGRAPAVVRDVAARVGPDPARLAAFAAELAGALHPALVLGSDVARADGWDDAVALAEAVGCPVWAAPSSERPPFPEDHPLYVGGLPFAQGPLAAALAGHDVVLVIGAPVFRYYPWIAGPHLPRGTRLLHITSDPAESARAPVGDSLVCDAVLALQGLRELVPARRGAAARVVAQEHRMAPHPPSEASPPDPEGDAPLTARQLFRVLRRESPASTILVEETPSSLADLHAEWPVTRPDSFWTFASGALGWDLPAAVGIALAERDADRHRPVLAVIGDGSFQYAPQALYTAARQRLPLVVVVPANGEYAILKAFAALEDCPDVPGLDLPGLSVSTLARGYGAVGVVARTADQVSDELALAWRRPGPTVIEVPVDPAVPRLG